MNGVLRYYSAPFASFWQDLPAERRGQKSTRYADMECHLRGIALEPDDRR
jgi:hypothetical protein